MKAHVPIEELVDVAGLCPTERGGPSPRTLREALPPGWVLDPGGRTAHRDLRMLARQGPVLALGLVAFGSAAVALFWHTFPRGFGGVFRLFGLTGLLLAAGAVVSPAITRALYRRPPRRSEGGP